MYTAAFALKGGDHDAAYAVGRSAESLLIQALKGTHGDIPRIPSKKPPLPDPQIETIARWIDEGAKAPDDEALQADKHWTFMAPTRWPATEVKLTDWPRNDIALLHPRAARKGRNQTLTRSGSRDAHSARQSRFDRPAAHARESALVRQRQAQRCRRATG